MITVFGSWSDPFNTLGGYAFVLIPWLLPGCYFRDLAWTHSGACAFVYLLQDYFRKLAGLNQRFRAGQAAAAWQAQSMHDTGI